MAENEVIDAPVASEQVSEPSLRDTIVAARDASVAKVEPVEPVKAEVKAEPTEGERVRDGQGRFTKGEEKEAPKPEAQAKALDSKEAPEKEVETALKAPSSWSPTAKAAFNDLPQPVQDAIAKRETEVNNGFQKLAEYKPLDEYVTMAKSSGTTLPEALSRYVAVENALRQDFVAGTIQLAKQQNINPVALAQHILARHGVSSAQIGGDGQQPANQTGHADLTPLQQEISALKENFQSWQQQQLQQEQAGIQTEIGRFASDASHPFFENVRSDMGKLIDSGQAETLDEAYEKACWADKEIRTLLIKQQSASTSIAKADDAVSRARAADKATGGPPSAGFKEQPKVQAGASIRDNIVAAVNSQRGI